MSSLRSLPRLFVPGATAESEFELPKPEVEKLRHVLRLSSGAEIAVLPDDGSIIRCRLQGHRAVPIEVTRPETEPNLKLTLAQALPKGEKLDEIVRACTEIGVSRFVLFPSERSVVRWDKLKLQERMRRLRAISMESAEVSFRTRVPELETAESLKAVLDAFPDATVLSEIEGVEKRLGQDVGAHTIVVGPEGGWSPKEVALIGRRGVTLGPRVLRVEHAGAAAAALLLLS